MFLDIDLFDVDSKKNKQITAEPVRCCIPFFAN